MTTKSRRAGTARILCALVMGAGLSLAATTAAEAAPAPTTTPAATAPADAVPAAAAPADAVPAATARVGASPSASTGPSLVWEADPTPLVVQARDYPVIMTITSGPKAGHQQRIAPRAHEVFPTSPNVPSSVTFTFDGVEQGQTYRVESNQVMRFDMQGSAQFPAVTLRKG